MRERETHSNLKRKRVPGIKGPGTHINHITKRIDMAGSTRLGSLLETSNTLDILLYIRDHPLCKKTDVYRNVSRNIRIPAKIDEMEDMGLILFGGVIGSSATHLSLTDKGVRLVNLLAEAETILNED